MKYQFQKGNKINLGRPSPRKGTKLSPEWIENLRKAAKGSKKPWLLGDKNPSRRPEVKEKMKSSWFKKGRGDLQRGKLNPGWKGGISALDKLIRNCIHYKNWRTAVFVRDDYTCQMCGARGVEIHADHIKALVIILRENKITTIEQAMACEEIWDTKNGRVLCVPCHKTTPNYAGRNLKN